MSTHTAQEVRDMTDAQLLLWVADSRNVITDTMPDGSSEVHTQVTESGTDFERGLIISDILHSLITLYRSDIPMGVYFDGFGVVDEITDSCHVWKHVMGYLPNDLSYHTSNHTHGVVCRSLPTLRDSEMLSSIGNEGITSTVGLTTYGSLNDPRSTIDDELGYVTRYELKILNEDGASLAALEQRLSATIDAISEPDDDGDDGDRSSRGFRSWRR